MITDIRLSASPAVERDAVDMLLACHQRIRNFTGIAARLADAVGCPDPEIANAAEAVNRYYAVALPLHEADENESVYPRLRQRLTDSREREALHAMVDQHAPIDELVAMLLLRWEVLTRAPGRLGEFAEELRDHARQLQELWNEHLALEEEIVFPLIRNRLTAEDLHDIHVEMKQRRGV